MGSNFEYSSSAHAEHVLNIAKCQLVLDQGIEGITERQLLLASCILETPLILVYEPTVYMAL